MTFTKDENRFFSVNHQSVRLIASYALKRDKLYSPQRIKNICELYGVLKNVWEKGNKPFELNGKSGKWKKITQSWLAEISTCSIKTIERRLKDLQDIGLIKYERQGYISHKYVQLIPISNAVYDDLKDKNLSLSCQTDCSLAKRKIVSQEEDKLTEPNIKREKKDIKDVFIEKRYKLHEELISHKELIKQFWVNRKKLKTPNTWAWQINELLKLRNIYGDNILESQLRESINKGWNSIEVSKYEKFNNIENKTAEYSKRAEKRLENMEIHARMLGKKSTWFNDPIFGDDYKRILFKPKN